MLLIIDKQWRISLPDSYICKYKNRELFISNCPGTDTIMVSPTIFDGSIHCHFDDRKRFILPSRLRRAIDIKPGDVLDCSIQSDGQLFLQRIPYLSCNHCIFCNIQLEDTYLVFKGKKVCINCISHLKELIEALPD